MKPKKKPAGRRRYHHPIHVSQTMARVLVSIYHALEGSNPQLAAEFRADPFGLRGKEAA